MREEKSTTIKSLFSKDNPTNDEAKISYKNEMSANNKSGKNNDTVYYENQNTKEIEEKKKTFNKIKTTFADLNIKTNVEQNNSGSKAKTKIQKKAQNEGKVTSNINENRIVLNDIAEEELTQYDKISYKIFEKKYKENTEFIKDLSDLIEETPIIEEFKISNHLFSKEDFDIFDNIVPSKFLFIFNIFNIKSVINLVWWNSKNNIKEFLTILNNIGINFSYVKRDKNSDFIDYVLLSPLPIILYNFISTNSEEAFKNRLLKNLAKSYNSFSDKYQYDTGYCYEDLNSFNLLLQIGESNYTLNPKVMYYLKRSSTEKLIKMKIIKTPRLYSLSDNKDDEYEGFNEVDISITMLKDVKLHENNNFVNMKIKNNNYDIKNRDIIFKRNHTYIFEFKTDVNDLLNKINTIENVNKRFLEAYQNALITQDIKYNIRDYEFIYICNKDKNDAIKILLNNRRIKDNKYNIIYSNPQVGVNALVKLNNNVKNLNSKIGKQKNKFNSELKDIQNKLNNEKTKREKDIEKLEEQIEKIKKEKLISIKKLEEQIEKIKQEKSISEKLHIQENYDNSLYALTIISTFGSDILFAAIKKIVNENKNIIPQYCEKIHDCYNKFGESYIKYKKELLYHEIKPFIGKKIDNEEEFSKWLSIKKKISEIVKKKEKFFEYYISLMELLYGNAKSDDNLQDTLIFFEENYFKRTCINKIILFVEILNNHKNIVNIELKFQTAIMFIFNSFYDRDIFNTIIKKEKNINKIVEKLISCTNDDIFKKYLNDLNNE